MNQNEQIIYLYSNVSNSSAQVKPLIEKLISLSKIPIKFLNVDSLQVKNMIKKSKDIKVKYVPSLILLSPIKNKIEVYEGDQFIPTVQKLIEAFTPSPPQMDIQNENNNPEMMNQMKLQGLVPSPTSMKSGKTSLDDILDIDESEDIINTKTKQKFGKTKLNLNPDVSPFADDGRMLIGNLNPPVRGEGHNEMKRSSISEFGIVKDDFPNENMTLEDDIPIQTRNNQKKVRFDDKTSLDDMDDDLDDRRGEVMNMVQKSTLKNNKTVPVKIGKKVEMIEDLSAIFESQQSEDSENYGIEKTEIDVELMRSSGANGNDSSRRDEKSKAMDSIKKEAERMLRDRELEGSQNRAGLGRM